MEKKSVDNKIVRIINSLLHKFISDAYVHDPLKFLFKGLIYRFVVGWLLCVPLSFITPKKKNLITFIGRDDGRFLDNIKYFYIFLSEISKKEGIDVCIITDNKKIYEHLKKKKIGVIYHSSFKSIVTLLRTKIVIVDNNRWIGKFKFHLLYRSKKVQIWHGVGFKQIGLNSEKEILKLNYFPTRIYSKVIGRFPNYHTLISTSNFYTNEVFKKSFIYEEIFEGGYPRNDIFFNSKLSNLLDLLDIDDQVYNLLKEKQTAGYRLVLYTPTFRDTGGDPISDNILDLMELEKFCAQHKIMFIFKLHPNISSQFKNKHYNHLLFYQPDKDIYPLMPLVDLMISDYSSIYMDFLLLNKPIVYFPYDYEKYITKDRKLDFDYEKFTPGPKCYSQNELHEAITNVLIRQIDTHHDERNKLAELAFEYRDGRSSERIWNHIKNKYL